MGGRIRLVAGIWFPLQGAVVVVAVHYRRVRLLIYTRVARNAKFGRVQQAGGHQIIVHAERIIEVEV
eukprot:6553766-Pyramimonas_sp.AAC.1